MSSHMDFGVPPTNADSQSVGTTDNDSAKELGDDSEGGFVYSDSEDSQSSYDPLTDPWDEESYMSWLNTGLWVLPSRGIPLRPQLNQEDLRNRLSRYIDIAQMLLEIGTGMDGSDYWIQRYRIGISNASSIQALQDIEPWMNNTFDAMQYFTANDGSIEYGGAHDGLMTRREFIGSRNGWDEWMATDDGTILRYRSFTTHGNKLLNLLLPHYNKAQWVVETLSVVRPDIFRPIEGAKVDAQIRAAGGDVLDMLIVGLDIAESAASLIPVAGNFVEGACGVLRKIIVAVKSARTFKESCTGITTEITRMALEVIQGLASSQEPRQVDLPLFKLYSALESAEATLLRIGAVKRRKILLKVSKYEAELQDVKDNVSNAFRAFNIQSHISISALVRELGYRMEELKAGQRDILAETREIRVGQTRLEVHTQDMHRMIRGLYNSRKSAGSSREHYAPDSDRISVVAETLDPIAQI